MKTIDTILKDLYVVHGLVINNLLISRIEFEPQHRTYILVGMSTYQIHK